MTSSADPFWTLGINVSLFWRPDGWGRDERALYMRDLYLGEVMHLPPRPRRLGPTWRAWLMTTDEGSEVGWFATEQEAKDALVDAALKALLPRSRDEQGNDPATLTDFRDY
jgi:hypothetical protein